MARISSTMFFKRVRLCTWIANSAIGPNNQEYTFLSSWAKNPYIDRANITLATEIQGKVDDAISNYLVWQRERLGQNINPSRLTHLVMGAGASRVEVATPNWQAIEPHQVAIEDAVTVKYGGLDE